MQPSTMRSLTLLSAAALIVGSLGPWESTFIADVAGTQGDGKITLALALVGGLVVLATVPGSQWLMLAGLLGVASSILAIHDLVAIQGSTEVLFGREVKLVSAGWGLWLTAVGAVAFAICAVALWVETPDPEPVDIDSEA